MVNLIGKQNIGVIDLKWKVLIGGDAFNNNIIGGRGGGQSLFVEFKSSTTLDSLIDTFYYDDVDELSEMTVSFWSKINDEQIGQKANTFFMLMKKPYLIQIHKMVMIVLQIMVLI